MTTSAERQRAWLARQRAEGLVQVKVMVPAANAPDVKTLAEALCRDHDLRLLMVLRHLASNRFVSVKRLLRPSPLPCA